MPACKLVSIETRPLTLCAARKIRHCALSMRPFRNIDDIAGEIEVRTDYLQARYAQFSRKITRAIGYRDMPLVLRAALVYQIESIGLVREAWRVLAILEIHVRRVIAFHYPIEHTHRVGVTKNFDPTSSTRPSSRTISGRRIDRRREKTPVSHRRRRFAVANNCS